MFLTQKDQGKVNITFAEQCKVILHFLPNLFCFLPFVILNLFAFINKLKSSSGTRHREAKKTYIQEREME
jgi:hypothetical protein